MKKKIYQFFAAGLSVIMFCCLFVSVAAPFINRADMPADDLNDPDTDIMLPEEDFPSEELPPSDTEISVPENGGNEGPDSNGDKDETVPENPEDTETGGSTAENTAMYVRSKVDGLSIRSGPGSSYRVLGHINKGDMVALTGKENGWYRTVYKNKSAYVSAGSAYTDTFTMQKSGSDTIEDVIDEGLRLLGSPYVYGATRYHDGKGNLIKGFNAGNYDCSSLMQYIYYHGADVNLNMTTRTQIVQGTHVPKNQIARGDLLFFTNSSRYNKTGIERVGHVAMYLGDNYILHTASDFAVIEQISKQRWNYYLETRRFVHA